MNQWVDKASNGFTPGWPWGAGASEEQSDVRVPDEDGG